MKTMIVTTVICIAPIIVLMFFSVGWRDVLKTLGFVAAILGWVAVSVFLGVSVTS